PECTIEYVNDSIYKILNYSPEECFGKKASILFPSEIEYNEYYKRLTEGIDRNEENIHIEQVLKKKDGELITTEINTTFLKEKNKVVRVISTIRDITLQKQANEKIKRFSRIFEDSLNEIYLFEADTLKFTQANRAAIHNLGYTMEELRELTPIHVKPEFTEESFEKLITPLRSGEKEKIVIETVHQRKDQSLYNSEVHLQLLKFENESIFAAIILDITERKHTEQVLRDSQEAWKTTFNAMTDWISLIDPKTRLIINANTACKKYTGLPINKVIGSKCYKAFNNSDKPHPNCPLERLLKSKKREEKEIQIGENGKWFLISADPVFDKNKEIVSVVHSVRDITDRKLSENKITHLNLVLQAISKVNHLIIEEKKSDILIKRTCKILTENRGYENAWIVLFNEKGDYLFSAESGLGKGFSPIQNILKNGKWPYCGNLALKKKDISIIDEPHKVCKDCPLSSNYVNNSSYTISLRHGDTIYGFLTVSIPKFLINDKEEQSLFKEIGGDISFALHNIEIETKREKSDKDLLEANKIINRGSAVAFLWKNEKSWPVE
ncbi:MAG: PAS domain S-box protein, partial [Bacteroidales bacterium]|nr:PAS domain S-box protein [Bacteroidales bacterium]